MCQHLDLGGENRCIVDDPGGGGIRRVAAALYDVQRDGDWQLRIGSEDGNDVFPLHARSLGRAPCLAPVSKMHSVGRLNLVMLIRARSQVIPMREMGD